MKNPHLERIIEIINDDNESDKYPDPDTFDKDLSNLLISIVRDGSHRVCHNCNKPQSNLTCSACNWSLYCSKDCQRKHWKECHKQICKDFRDNRKAGSDIVEAFRAAGEIDEKDYIDNTDLRWKLFLAQAKAIGTISLITSVIYLMGEVRHAVGISYYDRERKEVQEVGRFIMTPVDKGESAMVRIQRGSGQISKKARAKVVNNLIEFIEQAKAKGLEVSGITFGRGIVDLVDDKAFADRLSEIDSANTMRIPSIQYAM